MLSVVAFKAFAVWFGILLLAIANGALRDAVLIPRLGAPASLLLSGTLLSLLILVAAYLSLPWLATRQASNPNIAPVSRPWLVHARLDLGFLQSVAIATNLSPARRPAAPVLHHHPGYGCNVRANLWGIGLGWLLLTLAFEFSFGLWQGKAWSTILEAYTFKGGNIWPVVLVVIAVAPYVAARLRGWA